ncbi:MAG TPA: hypothetical protein VF973_14455 [Myxococcales bacterium]
MLLETGVGAVPVGLHTGEGVAERHRPDVQLSPAFRLVQSVGAVQATKQNEPVEVLTQALPAGQVVWSAGLHAEVQAPFVGNSGPLPQISPAAQDAAVHGVPRSALAGLFCAGQLAAGRQAPNPGQQVYPLRQSPCAVHAWEQRIPLPLARRSVHTAPLGQASPAQV